MSRCDPWKRRHRENAIELARRRLPDCGRVGNRLFEELDRACRRRRMAVERTRRLLQPAEERIASRSYGLGSAENCHRSFQLNTSGAAGLMVSNSAWQCQ